MNKIIVFIICFFLSMSIVQNSYSMAVLERLGLKVAKEVVQESPSFLEAIGLFFAKIFTRPPLPQIAFRNLSEKVVKSIEEFKKDYPREFKEIESWEAPSELESIEKLAYQLSCVVEIESQLGEGSGFYINEDTIISNHHVVEGKKQVNIKGFLKDNFINGNVIAYDKNLDLSAIKTSKGDHRPCIIEQSNSPSILSEVIAIGHPEGIKYRVTKGEISSYVDINKEYVNDPNSIQVTYIDMSADIYFGSSGGPLFYKGNVIGVVVGGIKDANINFAIHFRKVNEFINKNQL